MIWVAWSFKVSLGLYFALPYYRDKHVYYAYFFWMQGPTGCLGSEPGSVIETLPWTRWHRTVGAEETWDYSPAIILCDRWIVWYRMLKQQVWPHWPLRHGSQNTCPQSTLHCFCRSGRSHFYKSVERKIKGKNVIDNQLSGSQICYVLL